MTGNKVEWFRARLDLQQWREELEILEEEFKRGFMYFGVFCFYPPILAS